MTAKKLDSYMVSRIDSKEYLKKKLLKSVRYKLRYKDFRVGKATVQYGGNSPMLVFPSAQTLNRSKTLLSFVFETIKRCWQNAK